MANSEWSKDKKNGSFPPKKTTRRVKKQRPKDYCEVMPLWKVLLHNDNKNLFISVVFALQQVLRFDKRLATEKVHEANERKVTLLKTVHKEHAELLRAQLISYKTGLKAELTITIEPV